MKRVFVAALGAVALAAPASAFDVRWGGDFENRFMYSTQADLAKSGGLSADINDYFNVSDATILSAVDTKKKADDSDFFGEVKYRLTLTGTDDDKKAKGVLGFEFGGKKFGQAGNLDFGGDDNIFEFRWGYVDFEVPFDTSSRLMVGLMPVGYNKFLWSDNAAGVKYVSKRGSFGYSLGWFRDDVNNTGTGGANKARNDDAYAIDVTYTVPHGPKLAAFGIYLEEGRESVTLANASGDFILDPATGNVVRAVPAVTATYMDKQMWLGLAGEGQVGALFYGFTGIYLTGELDAGGSSSLNLAGTQPTLDRSAFLLNAEATYKFKNFRLKGGWLYSSGDDDPTDGDLGNFANIDGYMGGFGSVVIFDSYGNDNTLVKSPFIRDRGLNMPYLNLALDINDKASIGLSYLYVAAAEGIGSEKDLGHEVGAEASCRITKNLTAGIQAGYLIGGGLWDKLASDGDGDDVFRTDTSFRFKF